MDGCEGRLSVVAAVADMKGKIWGNRINAGNFRLRCHPMS